ncbi:glycosyltransferase family 87 protein [Salinarimonas soli]|nr:glycosyltransferase family 87 protein [Salinarimonas soli]
MIAGDDLSSLYFAARFIAFGEVQHVFSYDPVQFTEVASSRWEQEAAATGFTGYMHPYVQAPLWATMVSPLAARVSFPTFNLIFFVIHTASVVGAVVLVARVWAPYLLRTSYLGLTLVCLCSTRPLWDALYNNQTQLLVILLVLLAVERQRAGAFTTAGLALAIATLIKVTPVALAVYWLATGRRKEVAIWAGAMLVLGLASLLLVDPELSRAFVTRLRDLSTVLVMGNNNQSFPVVAYHLSTATPLRWQVVTMPGALSIATTAIHIGTVLALIWKFKGWPDKERDAVAIPIVLVTTMILAPIAWTHYFITVILFTLCLPAFFGHTRSSRIAMVTIVLVLATGFFTATSGGAETWTPFLAALLLLAALYLAPHPSKLPEAARHASVAPVGA